MRAFRFQVGVVLLLLAAAVVGVLAGSGQAAQERPAKAANTGPAIVVRDFRWVGFGKDMVGPTDARPNGERDGHFSLALAASGRSHTITSVSLWTCVRNGCPAPFATTLYSPSLEKWTVLGVSLAGKPHLVNGHDKTSWLRLPVSKQGVRLDLYLNDGPGCLADPKSQEAFSCNRRMSDHRLGPHQRFLVTLTVDGKQLDLALGNGRHALRSAWLRTPGRQPSMKQPIALGSFRYLGLDRDVAGSTYGSPPDGKLEAHFRLDFTASKGPGYLRNIFLTRAPAGSWSSMAPSPLTVFLDGRPLDLERVSPGSLEGADWSRWVDLRWSSARHRLDLYAYDLHPAGNPTWDAFAPGSRFTATVFVLLPNYVPGSTAGYAETSLTLPGG